MLTYFIFNQLRLTCNMSISCLELKRILRYSSKNMPIFASTVDKKRNTGKEGGVVVGTVPAGH
jgi:hypothetical protein